MLDNIEWCYQNYSAIDTKYFNAINYPAMKIGICKLCNNEKELRKSHVIPRSVFKRALKGFIYGRMLDQKSNKVVNVQDQWATYLLCAECESKLNTRYEYYSLGVLRGESIQTKHQEKNDYCQIVDVDQKRLILFVVSILWRALESNHEVFKNLTDLGMAKPIKEILKLCVYDNVLPRPQFFTVKISKLVTTIDEYKDLDLSFISNWSFSVDERGFVKSLLIMDGHSFEIFFHTALESRLTGLGILKANKRILKLPRIEAFSIPELDQSLMRMLEAGKNQSI